MRAQTGRVPGHARHARIGRALLLTVPLAFLGVFFVYPVASIIGRGLTPGGTLDLSPIGAVVTDAQLREVAWFTIWQATVSTVLTVLVALPGAYVFARYEFRGKRLVRA
ncbi:MAG TPA: iron ABC transporter permease, partial [Acidimicrobiia bacterium]|nr:iron ABC transporter permease [Acidimicrobiia bacterium]